MFFFSFLHAHSVHHTKKVTLQLSWFDQFQFAGYYIAKQKGFYDDVGLDVRIKPFSFGIDIPNEVSKKNIDFAVGRETLILDKLQGKDIVTLYALFQSTPLVLLSKKESGIKKIEHFRHKNIMTTIDDAGEVSLKAMIKSNNIEIKDLNFSKHSHNINDLIENKTDVISAYISKSPYILEKKGIEYNIFDPKQYGFDMYSDFLYTSNKLIENDKFKVEAFKEASLKGWEYAYSNIEESVELILKNYNTQNLTKEELLYEANELKKLSYFNTKKLGEVKEEKLQRIYDLYNVMGLTQNSIKFNSFIYKNKDKKVKLSIEEEKYLKQKKEILYCAIPKAMPHSYIKDGEVEGFAKDFIELIKEKLHLSFKLVPTETWAESLEYIKNKKCDLIPTISLTQKRKEYLNFTNSYTQLPIVLLTNSKAPFTDSLSNLKNEKIGVTKGFALYDELVKRYTNIEFIEVPSTEEGLEKVKSMQLYGQITSMGSAWYYLLQKTFHDDLKISGKIDEKISFRVGIPKDEYLLYEILNKAVVAIDKEEIKRIENKWAYIEYKKEFDSTLISQLMAVVFVILLFLLYRQNLLKKMNNELNKKVEEKTKELVLINHTLEDRIKKEVEENLKKDRILSRQTKMASMGEMIENIAHQWRQPLSVISTGASGLKVKKQIDDLDDEILMNTLDTIINSSQYLSHTIDDFRYFFKPNKEKVEFFIDHSLEKTISLLSSKFDDRNIQIIESMQKVKILGFETELIQVFINILNNARDALEISGVAQKYIFIDIKKIANKTQIRITDNAGGVDSDIIHKIFEPYFSTKHKRQGTGIGLYMCEQIIGKYMNGTIEVSNKKIIHNNKELKGAEFLITLFDE